MGNNVVRLTPSGGGLTIAAHYQTRVSGDNDLQSGVTILGSTGLVVGAGKDGNINLLGQSDLSLKQSPGLGGTLNLFAFWNGSAGPMLFAWPEGGGLHAYQVGAGSLTGKGTNSEQSPGHPGGDLHRVLERLDAGHGDRLGQRAVGRRRLALERQRRRSTRSTPPTSRSHRSGTAR